MQFQVFFGDYNVLYGPNRVDLSTFKCTSSGINKPLEKSFGSILKWLGMKAVGIGRENTLTNFVFIF